MDDSELGAWLRLASLTQPTPATLDALAALPGGIGALGGQSDRALAATGLTGNDITRLRAEPADLGAVRDWAAQPGHTLICWGGADYPPLLARIPDPPVLLYALGDTADLLLPLLAIVGSRKPTRGGLDIATTLADELCGAGFGVVSGLALGIDTAAHRSALAAGGRTVAVLGTGIDRVYPAANQALATQIVAEGCVISEFALGAEPRKGHFPRRNRLISGLAMGTLVVEAALVSGSLITARLAAEQGREVFAVPGSIRNPMARGCHRLIREGAHLIESTDDIIAELGVMTETLKRTVQEDAALSETPLAPAHQALLDTMGFDPLTVDAIAKGSALTIAEVSSMLLILELGGFVESLPGGRYARLLEEPGSS